MKLRKAFTGFELMLLGFGIAGLVAGLAALKQNLDPSTEAFTLSSCTANGNYCIPNGETCNPGDTYGQGGTCEVGKVCCRRPVTPTPIPPSPTPNYSCVNNGNYCIPNGESCSPGDDYGQGGTCQTGRICCRNNPDPTNPPAPTATRTPTPSPTRAPTPTPIPSCLLRTDQYCIPNGEVCSPDTTGTGTCNTGFVCCRRVPTNTPTRTPTPSPSRAPTLTPTRSPSPTPSSTRDMKLRLESRSSTKVTLEIYHEENGHGSTRFDLYKCEGTSCIPNVLVGYTTTDIYGRGVVADRNIKNSVTYLYQARARVGEILITTNIEQVNTPPKAPVFSSVTTSCPAKVTLNWGSVPGAVRYDVFRCDGIDCRYGQYFKISSPTNTIFVDNDPDMEGNIENTYYVQAYNGFELWSDKTFTQELYRVCVTPTPIPPGTFTQTPMCPSSNILEWSGVSGISDYHIERCANIQMGGCIDDWEFTEIRVLSSSTRTYTDIYNWQYAPNATDYRLRTHNHTSGQYSRYVYPRTLQTVTCYTATPTPTPRLSRPTPTPTPRSSFLRGVYDSVESLFR